MVYPYLSVLCCLNFLCVAALFKLSLKDIHAYFTWNEHHKTDFIFLHTKFVISLPFNRSVLHYAVLSGSVPIVNLLLKQGARINFEPAYNKPTPLDLAILKGDVEVVRLMLDHSRCPYFMYLFVNLIHLHYSLSPDISLRLWCVHETNT